MPDLLNRIPRRFVGIAGRRNRLALAPGAAGAAALLMLAAGVWSHTGPANASSQSNPALAGLAAIPTAARGPISAALGHVQSSYQVHGLQARNATQRFGTAFSRDGVAVAAGSAHVRFRLAGYGRAGAMRRASPVSPRVTANRVDYNRPGVAEWYANGPLGLEQGFDVSARPAGSGPLTLALELAGNVRPRLAGSGLLLERASSSLRYGDLSATDVRGEHVRSWLQLRSGRLLIKVDDRHAAYPLRIDPLVEQAKLTASAGAATDIFGWAAAVSPDTIAVGAPNRTVDGNRNAGAVYVFQKPASGWVHLTTQSAVLTVANAPEGIGLGDSVAISGDAIVAGAPFESVGSNQSQGAVYAFVKPASGWKDATQNAELTASDGHSGDDLGGAVAASGDTVVAGSTQHTVDKNVLQGEGYVFVKPASGWQNSTESEILRAGDGGAGDFLGASVAISGSTVVVGAPDHNGGSAEQGGAYLFTKPGAGWGGSDTQTAELTAADGGAGDHFGFAVAASGDTAFVGAPEHQVALDHQGAAYVFVKPFFGWNRSTSQTAELSASDGATGDRLGATLAASGDSVLAGALLHQVGPNASQGAAYLFTKPGDTWTSTRQTEELTASDGAAGELFGISVGLSGDLAVVGALSKIAGNFHQGASYLFAVPPTVAIASPADGATYAQNRIVTASFSCTAPDGTTITACMAPTHDGAPIDTSTLGQHTFTVSASDSDGISATQTSTYTIAAPGGHTQPGPGRSRLAISGVRQSASVWRLGRTLPRIAHRRAPVGTTFSFVLNQPARATLRFTQTSTGRSVRGKCAVRTIRNSRQPRCTRTIAAGTLTVNGHGGLNRVRFEGRLGRNKALRPGRYTITISAITTAGQRTSSRPLNFTITK